MSKFSLITIIFFSITISQAQVSYTALITEPLIGTEENANNLIRVVDDINKRDNVSQVIVLGNITANGKFDEFIWAQEILDGLNVPYFVIGGERDYFLSEGHGSEISSLWGDDKKIFYDKNFNLICFNTIAPEFSQKNHFDAETFAWFKEALQKSNSKRLITFSFYPISKSDNAKKFFESILGYKLVSFVNKEAKQSKVIASLEGFYLNRKNDWGYILISSKKDSIIIKKILGEEVKKKNKPEIEKSVFEPVTLVKSIEQENTFSSLKLLWSENFEKSFLSVPFYNGKNIYAGFKNGTVICITSGGEEKWRYDCKARIQFPPLISDDILVVANVDGDILTLNSQTGPPVQTIGIGEEITGLTVAKIGEKGNETNAVIAGTLSGKLYCYNLQTLESIWTIQISDDAIYSSIIYSDNKIFFLDKVGTLYCVSADNGMLIWKIMQSKGGWKHQSSGKDKTVLKVVDNNLLVLDTPGNIFCIDPLLGVLEWNIKNINGVGIIRVNNKNDLIIPTDKNKILTISVKLRKIIDETELPPDRNQKLITDLITISNNIFIGFNDGWVYGIKPKHKPDKIFYNSPSPIISLSNIDGNCLVTDYDGNFTLLKASGDKK